MCKALQARLEPFDLPGLRAFVGAAWAIIKDRPVSRFSLASGTASADNGRVGSGQHPGCGRRCLMAFPMDADGPINRYLQATGKNREAFDEALH
jgi:hypothetical protein